jgi:MiaB-like tRNA modifying enzyme
VERTAILPIAQGCRGRCSYCITKIARGELSSYDESMLVGSFRDFVSSGSREVLLTAQDTASYGADNGTDLPSLVRRCLETPGEYRVRIGMMNPDALKRCWEGLVSTFDDERMYRFLHIPVQSGSDAVLRAMRRKYTVGEFMELVDDLRSACPDVSIATDVICGFPGETDDDHAATMDLVRRLRADTVNITRFSPRPGTDAWSMPQVHGRIANERSKEMTALKNETELDVNSAMVGKEYLALCTEEGKEGMVMRTGNYRPVVVREPVEIGDFATVRVTENRATYLIGEIAQK